MEFPSKTLEKLKKIANSNYKKANYETVLVALCVRAMLQYECNQQYRDDFIENMLLDLAKNLNLFFSHQNDSKSVLFYDGFGLDTRGLVLIYLKALIKLGYRIIYITTAEDKGKQPLVMEVLKGQDVIHSPNFKHVERIKWLSDVICSRSFNTAFFYTTPWDTEGTIMFNELSGTCTRYQIDLTDHTFWLGINAFDYCIEFRDYGASNAHYKRGIPVEKLVELPYYPEINDKIEFQGFPFEHNGKKVIFSGGSLEKTIDQELTFYKIIEHIVTRYDDVIFLYAGNGEDKYIKETVKKYPGKVYFVAERKDLYQVLRHSYFYLNTYPIGGGLMIQYAAKAGCVPVTLKRAWDNDTEGILLDNKRLDETFSDVDKLYSEIKKLLTSKEHIQAKRDILPYMVIEESEFISRLDALVKGTNIVYSKQLQDNETKRWEEENLKLLSKRVIVDSVINKTTKPLYRYFPAFMMCKIICRIRSV